MFRSSLFASGASTAAAVLLAAVTAVAQQPVSQQPAAKSQPVTAYVHARILPGGGVPIADGVLVVDNGKIAAIGPAGTAIPDGAKVVDCTGKTITPGLIDASFRTAASLADVNEQSSEVTPQLRVPGMTCTAVTPACRARSSAASAAW
jgi:imidazolonepropionase-like amidohydrolase